MSTLRPSTATSFLDELREQRWDDHRLYHHSRVNQSLHFVSALCFLSAYVLIWFDLTAAVLIGWFLAMATRQTGHFVFEPKSYDEHAQMTHGEKESIKVGYNLARKTVLISLFLAMPALAWASPSLLGTVPAWTDARGFVDTTCLLWFLLGAGALVVRTVHLFFISGLRSGLVWFTKILTDPFHDVKIYRRSPLRLLKGERLDPMEPWPGVPA